MHILMVLDHPFPTDTRVENEARSLIDAGHEVTLLSVCADERPTVEWHKGIHVVRKRVSKRKENLMRGLAGTLPWIDRFVANNAQKIYESTPFDIIHVHDLYLLGAGIKIKKALGTTLVADLHENYVAALKQYSWSTRFPGKFFVSIPRWERTEKKWIKEANRIIVVIEENKDRIVRLGVDPQKVVVIPNTLNRHEFEKYSLDKEIHKQFENDFIISYIGGFNLHRGLASVIDAFAYIKGKNNKAKLLLVGDGSIRDELEEQVHSLDLDQQVIFEGWQPVHKLKSYILASDICLIPHLKSEHTDNTIPHKLFQYMYFERPIVSTNCDPLQRIVGKTGSGLIYDSGDSKSLARTLLNLMDDDQLRKEMGRRGKKAVNEIYNWDRTSKKLVAMYQELDSTQ